MTAFGPHACDQITLAIIIAVRHHRAVQAEQHTVDRHCGTQLVEDFIAHAFVACLQRRAGWLGPEAGTLDQLESFLLGAPPRNPERAGAQRAAIGMLAGREVKRLLVGLAAGRNGREGIRLGRKRGRENAHENLWF